jgi:DNA mismatch repair protein MutS
MPPSVVQRAEIVLQQLEARSNALSTTLVPTHLHETRTNGHHAVAESKQAYIGQAQDTAPRVYDLVELGSTHEWQSEEARMVALAMERSVDADHELDSIDICAITPLDALNLLFLRQRRNRGRRSN